MNSRDAFAPFVVWYPEHGSLGGARMFKEHILKLSGSDVVGAIPRREPADSVERPASIDILNRDLRAACCGSSIRGQPFGPGSNDNWPSVKVARHLEDQLEAHGCPP